MMDNNNPYLQSIVAAMQANDHSTALAKLNDWMTVAPENGEPYHILGLLHAQQGQFEKAVHEFKTAIKLDPQQAVYHSNLSNAYKKLHQFDLAFQHINQAIHLKPNYAEAHNNLGSLLYTQARYKEALPAFEKAIRLRPDYWEAQYNLANVFVKLDENLKAIEHYMAALKVKPSHQNSIQNLAMVYVAEKRWDEALPLLEQVLAWQTDNPEIIAQLGHLYLETAQSSKAIECYKKALPELPNRPEIHHNLAVLLLREKQHDKALAEFEKALALDPENDTAKHMIVALKGQNTSQAPTKYVADLFDQYASYYDKHVKEQLKYQAPGVLRQAVGKLLPLHTKQFNILDIGCGTGQCGVYFQDLAHWLVGVDISFEMLRHAKVLDAYHALCQMDIAQGLPGSDKPTFDLAIAADVLVYLGDLQPVFQAVKKVMKPEGFFALTVETMDESQGSFALQPTGRYAHSEKYIQELADSFKLKVEYREKIVLRKNEAQDIQGKIYILKNAV